MDTKATSWNAAQPLTSTHALQIKPFLLDLSHSRTIIVEGIFDYYTMEIFRQNRPVGILPSVGADSIKYYVSLMIAWQIVFARYGITTMLGERQSVIQKPFRF